MTDERLKGEQLEEQSGRQEEGDELALLGAERDEAVDRWKRTAADFENYKRRAARERQEYVVLANERLIGELLPVLDDLELRLLMLARGVERHGVRPIETDGQFDPHVHEALLSQPSEADEGSVIDVIQKGYRLGDRVVRPARVVVAAAPPAKEPHEGDA